MLYYVHNLAAEQKRAVEEEIEFLASLTNEM